MARLSVKALKKSPSGKCLIGALYTTIERLEGKGLITTWMGEATAERGGRAKRMVRVTGKGTRAAKEFYEVMMRVSSGASWAVGRAGEAFMTSSLWSLVELAARPLDRDERDAVLGDSLEAGDSSWRALSGVLGFVLRRQLLLWKGWRPWLAFGFAVPCTWLLMVVSLSVTCTSERLLGLNLFSPGPHRARRLLSASLPHLPARRMVMDERLRDWISFAADSLDERGPVSTSGSLPPSHVHRRSTG